MECKANLVSVTNDILTGKVNLTFGTTDKHILDTINSIQNIDLRLNAKKWAERRSLDANAYFHVLVGKLADSLDISKIKCKNILIARYGQQDFIREQEPVIIKTNIQPEDMLEQEFLHTFPCKTEIQDGKEVVYYKVYRPTHTLNSLEFSKLLNGTVDECKEQGIDTMSPNEIKGLCERWQIKSLT